MTAPNPDPADEAIAAIEVLLCWSRDALSGLTGLAELISYLESGGPLDIIAPRLLREVEHTAATLWRLPGPLADLWVLALRADHDRCADDVHRASWDDRRAS